MPVLREVMHDLLSMQNLCVLMLDLHVMRDLLMIMYDLLMLTRGAYPPLEARLEADVQPVVELDRE
eukprot:13640316-Alexandrium_andersonii.AAC.1